MDGPGPHLRTEVILLAFSGLNLVDAKTELGFSISCDYVASRPAKEAAGI